MLSKLQELADQSGTLDRETQTIDTTVIRAHQHAAGARGGQQEEALGRSRGGFGTKLHLKCEGNGRPLAIHLTGGERSEMTGFLPLLNAGRVKRLGPGRPKQRPMQLIADRGYSSYKVRKELRRRGIRPVLPPKRGLQRPWFYDSEQYRKRNHVERAVNRLKRYRRIATRYDKCAKHFQTWTLFACVLEWLVP